MMWELESMLIKWNGTLWLDIRWICVWFCEDCQILEQVVQRGCGVCDPGGFQNPEIPDVNSMLTLLCGGGWTSRGPFQPEWFWVSLLHLLCSLYQPGGEQEVGPHGCVHTEPCIWNFKCYQNQNEKNEYVPFPSRSDYCWFSHVK